MSLGAAFLNGTPTGTDSGVNLDITAPTFGGHYVATYSKSKILGVNVPVGASFDVSLTATVTASMSAYLTSGFSCSADLPSLMQLLTVVPIGAVPVPIAIKLTPTVEVSGLGSAAMNGPTVSGTLGFWFKGSVNGPVSIPFTAGLTSAGTYSPPTGTLSGSLDVKWGGRSSMDQG